MAAIVAVTLALHVVWLVRFRHGYLTEWDESGYMQFSLSNFDALHDDGLWTFAKTVGGRETFGPLLPLVTSLAYPALGRGVFGSLLVLPLFYVGLVAAAFALSRQLVSASWAVVAALTVAARLMQGKSAFCGGRSWHGCGRHAGGRRKSLDVDGPAGPIQGPRRVRPYGSQKSGAGCRGCRDRACPDLAGAGP